MDGIVFKVKVKAIIVMVGKDYYNKAHNTQGK